MEICSLLYSLAADAAHSMSSGAPRSGVEDEEDPSELVAVIGFTGDRMSGVLGLSASRETLISTHPFTADGGTPSAAEIQDWLGELVNQLLGRFKAQLGLAGFDVWMSTPVVLRGISIHIVTATTNIRRYQVHMDGGRSLTFWVDLQSVGGEVHIPQEPASPMDDQRPGDVLLF